jgi:putative ABC transport system ATP-binding protein
MLLSLKQVQYKNILRYPDITIREGGVIAVTGKSGSGKSTLLKLFNGTISPTEGTAAYKDKNLAEYDPLSLRREVLLVSQNAYLFDGMSVYENFRQFYDYLQLETPSRKSIQDALTLCAADKLGLDADTTVFSGGERQRVFLAINISLPSKVIMLDEPTSALDWATADTVMANIKESCRQSGRTLVLVSHDSTIVDKFADEVICL